MVTLGFSVRIELICKTELVWEIRKLVGVLPNRESIHTVLAKPNTKHHSGVRLAILL